MKTTRAAAVLSVAAVIMSMSAMAADPTISGVMIQQRWPWSRLVDIDYLLTCEPGQSMDITVSLYNGDDLLDVPQASFSSGLYGVQRGAGRIVWDPSKTAYTNDGFLPELRVALTPALSPLYMIVDLTKSAGEAGQIEYVYEAGLTNGFWGAWVRNPVTNAGTVVESVIWTGVTTNEIYKTDKLVLRRISAGASTIGESKVAVTLSRDFYAGVYQVTQAQWAQVSGTNPSQFVDPTNPVDKVTYNIIRGLTNSIPAIDWPETGALVLPSSFLGLLRAKTGLSEFDLPTEAQWEYACRAGTTTAFNNGKTSGSSNDHMNELGWWNGNSESTTHPVGQKMPNAWGLYDMHGNVREWCLDWWIDPLVVGGADPDGPESGIHRVHRGSYYSQSAGSCSSEYRWRDPPTYNAVSQGFRLVMTLP